jgi:uncharacterized membrane protein YjgN (DUF898 family)
LLAVYVAFFALTISWSPGVWAVPEFLMNAALMCGLLSFFTSLFALRRLGGLAIAGLVVSIVTLAILLLPVV